ncbi:MAG: YvcK family protein [Candidatus Omnitrophica bacterium]|nr:YvcK family protein [Candidatus Omnitrophota bacterium]HOX54446.1 YvcK family protein [Candidatus Omnitrophota bacterium]
MKLNFLKWFYPGMGIKRWIGLAILGIIMVSFGSANLLAEVFFFGKIVDTITIFLGIILIVISGYKILVSFISVFLPKNRSDLATIFFARRQLERGPKIVAVGGGHGLSMLLHGIKEYTNNITAIVTVADSGGSSGRLREQFDVLPPGDIRNCLVALADSEPLMQKLFQFRFEEGGDLKGHNFGNLFITALTKVTGDFEAAIKASSKVLAIRGEVIPSTLQNVSLVAEYKDGSIIQGEHRIPEKNLPIRRVSLVPGDSPATEEAVKAIKEAEVILLGPGSLYTSIIPNLLTKGITDAISDSKVLKIYVCNVMTQPGETDGYKASDHVEALVHHSSKDIINHCIVNINTEAPKELLERYKREQSFPVIADSHRIKEMGYSVVEEELISASDFLRHDSAKLSKLIINLILGKRPRKTAS